VTTKLHSNGYVNLDWSSSFHVDSIEAATSFVGAKSGGSTPGGAIPAGGYNWSYWIPGTDTSNSARCYPPKVFPPATVSNPLAGTGGTDPTFGTYWNKPDATTHACPATPKYSQNNQVIGDIYANTVQLNAHSDTSQFVSGTTCPGGQPGIIDTLTGSCIPDRFGDIHTGKFSLGGTVKWTGPATGNAERQHVKSGMSPDPCTISDCVPDCTFCNQGTADNSQQVGGSVYIHNASFSPGTIPFPNLNYQAAIKPLAKADQGGVDSCSSSAPQGICHIFPTGGPTAQPFLTYLATNHAAANSTCSNCVYWLKADKTTVTHTPSEVAYVVAKGNYYITGTTDLNLDWQVIRTLFGTPATAPTPVIMVAGGLTAEGGDMTVKSSITVVGPAMDPFDPLKVYPASYQPGLLAAGGSINASDYDDDKDWDTAAVYEPLQRNSATIRGLVYSAKWDAATQKSIPADQHWHNYDPKNSTTIIGAQAGGTLHDCSAFVFSYDPLVANMVGFSGGAGGAYIASWQEIPTP
jgi:hypothetical protein